MSKYQLRELVVQLAEKVGLKRKVYIRRTDFKRQVASVSFRKNIVRVNKKIFAVNDLEIIKYVILHELVHLKFNHPYHNEEFFAEMGKLLSKDISWYDKRLLKYGVVKSVSL